MKPVKSVKIDEVIAFIKSVDKRTWVTGAATAVGILLLWFGFVGPAWIERPVLRRKNQEMTRQIIQVNGLNEKKPVLEGNLKLYSDLIAATNKRLFTTEEIGLLLGQISKLAYESRVEVIGSRPLSDTIVYPAPYDAKYAAHGYEFTVLGGYHDLGKFLAKIESYDKLLRVHRLHIAVSDKTPELHRAELKVLAFTAAPPLPPAKVPAKKSVHAKK